MTQGERLQLLERFNPNPGATTSAIAEFRKQSGLSLPAPYVEFLRTSNGGEGFIGPTYLMLWRVEELIEFNSAYEVAEYAPGLLIFGSDGGGEAFAFDTQHADFQIMSVPFVGMDRKYAHAVALDFDGFLLALRDAPR